MPRARSYALVAAGGVLLVPLLLVLAYLVDDGGRGNTVASNVSLVGARLDGLRGAALEKKIDAVARRVEAAKITVVAPKGDIKLTAVEVKLRVDRRVTARSAIAVGRHGNVVSRSWQWLIAFLKDREAPVEASASGDAVYALVGSRDKGPHRPATEPTLKLEKGSFVALAGKDGTGIDPAAVLDGIRDSAHEAPHITIHVGRGTVAPRLTLDQARELAKAANKLSKRPLPVAAGTATADVSTAMLQSWLRPSLTDAGPRLTVDPKKALEDLARAMPDGGRPPVETRFNVVDGRVLIVDGSDGTGCCAAMSIEMLNNALETRPAERLRLPLKVVGPQHSTADAATLGIVERVATFTTPHPAGQPRVKNIHLIADTVSGSVIKPGNTFSLNGTVGERTLAKGYVVDHVIEDSVFAESVGGGISQFATTLFNAAFFAGLELKSYQAHTLYISRYPYGREATMGWPAPDLVLRNASPYGILIWPSYTGTSLSVDLYSTRWVEATQSGQTQTPNGECTKVKTDRTRRFLSDGHTATDSVYANYRPKEGVNCDGSISPKLTTTTSTTTTTTTTTRPSATTTTRPTATTTGTTAPP